MSEPLVLSAEPPRPGHIALRIVTIGAILIAVAATPYFAFDLDRFFIPKELVLHLTAAVAALFAWRAMRSAGVTRAERLLLLYLLLSALSTIFATNRWVAFRALAISVSGVLLYFVGRGLRARADALVRGLAIAVTVIAATSLVQAYGIYVVLFSLNRAPGGTLGNRNFIAHAAAFGLPLCVHALLHAEKARWGLVSIVIVTAALVLTRSRAAWLATAAMLLVFFVALIATGALRESRARNRLFGAIAVALVASGLALVLPNALHWKSDNPYLESLHGLTKYKEGSAHGRLIQYRRSLVLSLHHPLLGTGPGNWAVDYPHVAVGDDPSLDSNDHGMTTNPWPSSDWVAFVSERGLAATIVLALALALIALPALKTRTLNSATLLGVLAAAIVAGMFDALLLLALPTLLVWPALGALGSDDVESVPLEEAAGRRLASRRDGGVPMVLLILCSVAGAARSSAQLYSMSAFVHGGTRATLEHAAQIDPSNYRLQMRLARIGKRSDRCDHARTAHELYPNADAARQLSRPCATRK